MRHDVWAVEDDEIVGLGGPENRVDRVLALALVAGTRNGGAPEFFHPGGVGNIDELS